MEEASNKKVICVTGGTGHLASWLIFNLLGKGYYVNATIRSSRDHEKNISYLTDLPGAAERLRVFNADLDKPDSFNDAIEGCIGVFHIAHPMDFGCLETEEEKTRKAINGTLGILQACINSKTVRRVVYTSAMATVVCDRKFHDTVDESIWSDIDFVRSLNMYGGVYAITKILTEKACLEFAEKHGLDLVTVIPSMIHGPFITPNVPIVIRSTMAMILGGRELWNPLNYNFVHVDEVARAHIFLFEFPAANGRYICSAVEITAEDLARFLASRYPQYQLHMSSNSSEKGKLSTISSKKLLETGFNYKYGLEEMFDDAIRCCKEKGLL